MHSLQAVPADMLLVGLATSSQGTMHCSYLAESGRHTKLYFAHGFSMSAYAWFAVRDIDTSCITGAKGTASMCCRRLPRLTPLTTLDVWDTCLLFLEPRDVEPSINLPSPYLIWQGTRRTTMMWDKAVLSRRLHVEVAHSRIHRPYHLSPS